MNTLKQNNFGALSRAYSAARRGYPDEVFTYIASLIGEGGKRILDLGCGTGIATRQLAEFNFAPVGADKDEKMLAVARESDDGIVYIHAESSALPFDNNTFDAVTAFTAFHWFADDESTQEIKRVLKEGGVFFAIFKRQSKAHQRKEYTDLIAKYTGGFYDSAKDYFPEEVLSRNGFREVNKKSYYAEERYTIDEALIFNQSTSYWNLVSEDQRPALLDELRAYYAENLIEGFVVRYRENEIVYGYK